MTTQKNIFPPKINEILDIITFYIHLGEQPHAENETVLNAIVLDKITQWFSNISYALTEPGMKEQRESLLGMRSPLIKEVVQFILPKAEEIAAGELGVDKGKKKK